MVDSHAGILKEMPLSILFFARASGFLSRARERAFSALLQQPATGGMIT